MEYKRFLKKFSNESEYNSQKDLVLAKPHVVLINELKKVLYCKHDTEPSIDYSKEYFTIEALEDGLTVSLSQNASEYRIDEGNWISLGASTATPSIDKGQKISFKITNPTISSFYGIGTFTVSKAFNVNGNIMSLLYGDNFEGQIDLSGKDYAFSELFYNCTTLQNAENLILSATTLAECCYQYMFANCTSLTTAPKLPAETIAWDCYNCMFFGCTSLTEAPELLATTLAGGCYQSMFNGCNKLNYIKMLATDISANYCLNAWVSGVASSGTFVKHPQMATLPSGSSGIPNGWTVEDYYVDYTSSYFTIEALEDGLTVSLSRNACEYRIDNGSWNTLYADSDTPSINKGQKIHFKIAEPILEEDYGIGRFTISKQCNIEGNIMSLLYGDDFIGQTDLSGIIFPFSSLFSNCTTLQSAENLILPVTTLVDGCYQYMFADCTSLTKAPELPATELAYSCYDSMFYGCTNLQTAPELLATKLAPYCYSGMFQGCTSLIEAPELPATTLEDYCYLGMFEGCTSLTTAPELIVTTLRYGCYYGMFEGCTSLTTAPELPATELVDWCYNRMFNGCSKLNYIKMLATDISANSCLSNWVNGVAKTGTFVKHPDMTSLPSGASGIPTGWTVVNDGEDILDSEYFTIEALEDGLTVSLSRNACEYRIDDGSWISLAKDTATSSINTGQQIQFKIDNPTISSSYGIGTFTISNKCNVSGNIMSLLYGDDFIDKNDLTDKDYAFYNLFRNCTKIVDASELILPATTLANNCYHYMFYGCTSLTTAPELPATTLASSCYSNMFSNCTSLTTAPELHATTLASYCYRYMFKDCTSLTSAPELLATKLTTYCYSYMFRGCKKLNYIKMLATDISANSCLSNWVSGVASSGTFVKNAAMTSLPSGVSGIPNGWTVEDYVETN